VEYLILVHADIIGYLGAGMYLAAYVLLQLRRGFSETLTYSLINLVAASMVAYSLLFMWNGAAIMIQLMWILISVYGITRCIRLMPGNRTREVYQNGDLTIPEQAVASSQELLDAQDKFRSISLSLEKVSAALNGVSINEHPYEEHDWNESGSPNVQ